MDIHDIIYNYAINLNNNNYYLQQFNDSTVSSPESTHTLQYSYSTDSQ